MKNEYLKELLRDNKTVIIPGLGAFVNNDSKTQPVIFNAFLKFNDGLVIGYISKKEGISIDEASKKNEVFVSGVLSLIESGRDVRMEGIGILKKDKDGKLQFIFGKEDTNEIVIPPAGKEEEKEQQKKEQQDKEQQEKEIADRKKAEQERIEKEKAEEEKKERIEKEKELKQKEEKIVQLKKEEKNEKPELKADTEETEKKEGVLKEEKNITRENKSLERTEKKKPEKKKKKLVLVISLLILLSGGGTAGFLYKDQLMKLFKGDASASTSITAEKEESNVPEPEPLSNETPEAYSDTIIEEVTPTTENHNEKTIVEEPVTPPEENKNINPEPVTSVVPAASGTFYVIAGCFRNDSNAEAMISKANSKGLSGMNIGTFGDLIHVAVFSSSNRPDAMQKAREIRSEFPNAWVMKKK